MGSNHRVIHPTYFQGDKTLTSVINAPKARFENARPKTSYKLKLCTHAGDKSMKTFRIQNFSKNISHGTMCGLERMPLQERGHGQHSAVGLELVIYDIGHSYVHQPTKPCSHKLGLSCSVQRLTYVA